MPPAFNLSQDQTLQFDLENYCSKEIEENFNFYIERSRHQNKSSISGQSPKTPPFCVRHLPYPGPNAHAYRLYVFKEQRLDSNPPQHPASRFAVSFSEESNSVIRRIPCQLLGLFRSTSRGISRPRCQCRVNSTHGTRQNSTKPGSNPMRPETDIPRALCFKLPFHPPCVSSKAAKVRCEGQDYTPVCGSPQGELHVGHRTAVPVDAWAGRA